MAFRSIFFVAIALAISPAALATEPVYLSCKGEIRSSDSKYPAIPVQVHLKIDLDASVLTWGDHIPNINATMMPPTTFTIVQADDRSIGFRRHDTLGKVEANMDGSIDQVTGHLTAIIRTEGMGASQANLFCTNARPLF